ncbi:MAG: ribonuclease HII [Minisyncoccia bacterium]
MNYVVGIDEVGRGPLAGPVTVCLVCCEDRLYRKLKQNRSLPKLGQDSKKISEKNRQKYSLTLKSLMSKTVFDISKGDPFGNEIGMWYVVNHVSNRVIDQKGISFAIEGAIATGIKGLNLDAKNCIILLDGGLRVPKNFKQKTIIKGDEREKIISWASILAKVSRDDLMINLSRKYSFYGFDKHKGYGTKHHREMILEFGLSKIHRKTFCKKLI